MSACVNILWSHPACTVVCHYFIHSLKVYPSALEINCFAILVQNMIKCDIIPKLPLAKAIPKYPKELTLHAGSIRCMAVQNCTKVICRVQSSCGGAYS